ncbi:CU044_5270 family protein, partial [Actinomadura bangladeshensis]|uniref:CU044_5270 family protein n=1 Tax=Actinomadura bangladeshensis TaxID=453573 RepID=UPI0019441BE0
DDAGPPAVPPADIALGTPAEAAHVLDRAAAVAATRPSAGAAPRQWVYTKMRLTSSAKPAGLVTGGPYRTETWEVWRRGDGKQYAAYENGRPRAGHELVSSAVASGFEPLPSDPEALLRKIRRGPKGGGGDQMAYETLVTILRDSLHAPETEAAIFQAIKLIPGVTPVEGEVEIAGRPAIALGLTVEGWLHEEVLLDPETFTYLGERAIAVKTRTFVSDGDPAVTVKAGTLQRLMVRVAIGVVAESGRRP